MRIKDFNKDYTKYTDLDNMFNIHQDKKGNYIFNYNSTLYLDIPEKNLKFFTTDCDMHWPLISYKIYKTTRLFWLLMKLNGIDAKRSFAAVPAASRVKYLDTAYIPNIVSMIEER